MKKNKDIQLFFKVYQKIYPEKFVVHTYVLETFYKITISQKLNKFLDFFIHWVVVYTVSFNKKAIVVFCKN